ncbi:MAG: DUF4157 domain-containing protein [Chitinophagaceae bacterium]
MYDFAPAKKLQRTALPGRNRTTSTQGKKADAVSGETSVLQPDQIKTRPVHKISPRIQRKLSVNSPNDSFEREADQVAEEITGKENSLLQRKCSCGGSCPDCSGEDDAKKKLQAKHSGTGELQPLTAPESVHDVLRSTGNPLDEETRALMEQGFGYDFSKVRVHTDTKAGRSAKELNALAYTVGKDVVFGAGHYAPKTTAGRKLLAHELTHVVQQGSGMNSIMRQVGAGGQPLSLSQTLIASRLSAAELENEITLLREWLDLQTATTVETDRMFQVLGELEQERDRRGAGRSAPPPVRASSSSGLMPARARTTTDVPAILPFTTIVSGGAASERRPMMAVEEQFGFMLNQMGFMNTPAGAMAEDAGGTGAGVGPARAPGFHVYSAIQVVDPRGRQVVLGFGAYLGGSGLHAEEEALRVLRSILPRDGSLRGGRLITTVTQDPCGPGRHNCAHQLQTFASEYGLVQETYVPVRDAVRPGRSGARVSGPTASRGAQRTDRPPVSYRRITPATTSVTEAGDGTRSEIGTPDMRGLSSGGPSPRGEAIVSGMTIAFMGVNFVLNMINDHIQEQRVHEALARLEGEIRVQREQHPDRGVLLVFFYSQIEAPEESLMRPGAVFGHIEYYTGSTEDEARQTWHSSPAIREGHSAGTSEITQANWIPPQVAPSVRAIRTPFPRVATGTFVTGRAILQDVNWGGITGFDDEGTSSLTVGAGQTPGFFILQVPSVMHFFNGSIRQDVNIPVEQRSAHTGGNIPVVDLDPYLPGYDTTAACVFPADDETDRLFDATVPTHDTLGQLRIYNNFGKARWVLPENIDVSGSI